MPLGDIAAEFGVRLIGELIVYGVCYWTGRGVIFLITLGTVNVAPFSLMEEKNKKRGFDWSIWLHRGQTRLLKAEVACLVGLCNIVGSGVIVWVALK